MSTGEFNAGGNPAMNQQPIQGGSKNTPCHLQHIATEFLTLTLRLQPDRPLGSYVDLTNVNNRLQSFLTVSA